MLVPLLALGYNPIIAAMLVCIIVTVFTLLSVGSFNKKSLSAILGTAGGLFCATVVTLVFSALMRISGIDTPTVEMLAIIETDVVFNYQGILTAGILIGCIGVVMDVGMSISSAVNEMHTICRSAAASCCTPACAWGGISSAQWPTLILAYTGGTIMMMVAWQVYGVSYADMLNKGFILIKVAKSLCGSIGMVMTIPLTAFISAHRITVHTGGGDPDLRTPADAVTPLPQD